MIQDPNRSPERPDTQSDAASPQEPHLVDADGKASDHGSGLDQQVNPYGAEDDEELRSQPHDAGYRANRYATNYATNYTATSDELFPPPPRRSEQPLPPPFKSRQQDEQHPAGEIPKRSTYNKRFDYSQQDIQSLRTALNEKKLFSLAFYFLDYILRAQTALFEQIHRQQELPRMIASMVVLCGILSGIYGMTMGINHSLWQVLSAAVKLPLLFTITAVICIPSLYTFNVLLGQRFRFLQTAALMVMTLGTTTILLASLSPIAVFFTITSQNYQFLLLMHVVIFGLCGVYGVQYLYRGCTYLAFRMEQPLNNLLLRIWIVIYALVGMQLGWRLRPFVGNTGTPFALFREEQDGNFYLAVWNALNYLMNGQ